MAQTCFIDGSQLSPTDFGEFDSDSGIWKPIDITGLTLVQEGYYLIILIHPILVRIVLEIIMMQLQIILHLLTKQLIHRLITLLL